MLKIILIFLIITQCNTISQKLNSFNYAIIASATVHNKLLISFFFDVGLISCMYTKVSVKCKEQTVKEVNGNYIMTLYQLVVLVYNHRRDQKW